MVRDAESNSGSSRRGGAESLIRTAASGVVWTAAERVGGRVLNFVVFAILAHLLAPEDFGLIALAMVVIAFGEILAGQGLTEAIIQAAVVDQERLSTAFWINVGGGGLLFLLGFTGAPFFAEAFHEPGMPVVLRALSFLFLISGISGVHHSLLAKQMRFRSLAVLGVLTAGCGAVVGVALALAGFGVWSLVGQSLSASMVGTVMLWRLEPWRPGFVFSGEKAKGLLSFGWNVVAGRFAGFLNRRGDDLVIGAVLGSMVLGYYTVAYRVILALTSMILGTVSSVAFPVFVRVRSEARDFAGAYALAVFTTSFVAFPAFLVVGLYAREIVLLAFGGRWLPSVPVLQVLSIIGLFHGVAYPADAALLAQGKPSVVLKLKLVNAALNFLGFVIAVRWGIVAVAAAFVIRAAVMSPLQMVVLGRSAGLPALGYLRAAAIPFGGSLIMGSTMVLVSHWLPPSLRPELQFVVPVVIGSAVYAGTLLLGAPATTRRAVSRLVSVSTRSVASKE